MEYQIDRNGLLDRVEEEISHIADASYADTGQSLYDTIVLTEKDRAGALRLIEDAVGLFVKRTFDICRRAYDTLVFSVPDFDESMTEIVQGEISDFLVFYPVATICQSRKAERAQEFTQRAQDAIDKAAVLLKSRKLPE